MNHIKYSTALALVVASLASTSGMAWIHYFYAFPDFETHFDARYASAFCRDDWHLLPASGSAKKDVGGCGVNSIRAKIYDPGCFKNSEPMSDTEKNAALTKYQNDLAAWQAQQETIRRGGLNPLNQAPEVTGTGAPAMPTAPQNTEWQWVQNPRTGEWSKIRPYIPGTGTPTTLPIQPTLPMPQPPVLTKNFCHADRYLPEAGFAGHASFRVIKVATGTIATEPAYKVIRE